MQRTTWKFLGALAFTGTAVAMGAIAVLAVRVLRAASASGAREDVVDSARAEATAATAEHERVVHAEHAIEHGKDGRARGMDQSRTPNVSSLHANAGLYPSHTRRHG